MCFSIPEHIVSNNGKLKNNNLHYFTFSEKMANMQIKSAKLYVHVKTLHHEQPDKKNVEPVHIRIMERLQTKENDSPMSVDYGYVQFYYFITVNVHENKFQRELKSLEFTKQ